jgi:hypothetical protein
MSKAKEDLETSQVAPQQGPDQKGLSEQESRGIKLGE